MKLWEVPRVQDGPTGPASDDELFERLYSGLRALAAVASPPEVEPDDLVQEALVHALRRGPLSDLDHPGAYLRRSIVNLASNERRRLGRQRAALARLRTTGAAAPVTYPSDLAHLLGMTSADRAVLWLADVEGCPFNEVAEVLGCSEQAARARASRARRRLRQLVEEVDS